MSTIETWWGVINAHGKLSQVYAMRGLTESAIAGRQDRADCWLAPIQVTYNPVRPSMPLVEKSKGKR